MSISVAQTYASIGIVPSPAQLASAKAILGERLTGDEQAIARQCSGRADDISPVPFQEATIVVGRKGGKTSRVAAPLLVHLAVTDADPEPGVFLLCAPSKSDQATVGWQSITRQLERGFPSLVKNVREGDGQVELYNGNVLRTQCANFRSLRGPRFKCAVVDEACFFVSDDPELGLSNPLEFVLDAIAGGMVATQNPLLLLLSTPWTKSGVVWEHWRDRAATPERLVWQAPTLLMNPSANQALMEKHRRDRGEAFYRREYLAEFGDEAAAYIEPELVDAAIAPQPFFPLRSNVSYVMGLDPGRKRDHFGAAVAHREGGTVVCDWCAEWKPGFLSGLKYADILPQIWEKAREYRVRTIASDMVDFGGIEASIPVVNRRPEFKLERVISGGQSGAEMCDVTRALFANRKMVLPNQPGLADEFKRLADFISQGGSRDVRAKRGADDRSRAVMLAVFQAYRQPPACEPMVTVISLDLPPATSGASWNRWANLQSWESGPERWWH